MSIDDVMKESGFKATQTAAGSRGYITSCDASFAGAIAVFSQRKTRINSLFEEVIAFIYGTDGEVLFLETYKSMFEFLESDVVCELFGHKIAV